MRIGTLDSTREACARCGQFLRGQDFDASGEVPAGVQEKQGVTPEKAAEVAAAAGGALLRKAEELKKA